jgi:hypothetical protein
VVGRRVAGRRRRHVAEHEVGRSAERGDDGSLDLGLAEIALDQHRAGDRLGRRQVDADDDAAAPDRVLRPPARRAAEV